MPDYIAIGDIHGVADLLDELLDRLPSQGELIFLGDYIDRGPDAKEVVCRLLALAQERPCHFLRGNHEAMLLDVFDKLPGKEQMWLRNGGYQTIESYDGRPSADHEAFFRGTLPYYETAEFIFVHAGLRPGLAPAETSPDELYWIRHEFLSSNHNWGRLVVHGHTPTVKFIPDIRPNRVNIDTGAVYGGQLTALLLPERDFISVR